MRLFQNPRCPPPWFYGDDAPLGSKFRGATAHHTVFPPLAKERIHARICSLPIMKGIAIMAGNRGDQIIESAQEARQAERGPTVTCLAIAALMIV